MTELPVDFLFQPAERIIRIGSRAAVVCNRRDILTGIIGNGNISGPRHAAAFREGIAVRLGKGSLVSTLLIIRHGLRQRQVECLDSGFIFFARKGVQFILVCAKVPKEKYKKGEVEKFFGFPFLLLSKKEECCFLILA